MLLSYQHQCLVKSTFVCLHIGDNILTAVNVAKSCGMVGSDEKVIFVNATPHTAQSMPTLRFNLEDGGATASQSAVEVITQVGPAHTHTHTHTHNTAVHSPLLILFISWVHSAAKWIYSTPVRRRVVCDSVWQFCDSDTVWMTAVTLLLMNEYLREWPSTCVMTEWDLLSHSHALGPERHCDKVWLEMET